MNKSPEKPKKCPHCSTYVYKRWTAGSWMLRCECGKTQSAWGETYTQASLFETTEEKEKKRV